MGAATIRRRRRSSRQASDPLGAGNTQLLLDLGLTPLLFHDVRKLGTPGAVGSLSDVSGAANLYGGPLTQAASGKQPVWDGTTLTFDGSDDWLASALITALDLSTPLTAAIIADVPTPSMFTRVAASIGPLTGVAPWWEIPAIQTGPAWSVRSDRETGGVGTTAATGTGAIRLALYTVNVASTGALTIEVLGTAKGTGSSHTVQSSGACALLLGAFTNGAASAALRYRASLVWAGGYTTGQRDTLHAWAQEFHNEEPA